MVTSGSIGISLFPQDGKDADQLIKNADSAIVVSGVSCRQQVQQGTQVTPRHLVEFLADQLKIA